MMERMPDMSSPRSCSPQWLQKTPAARRYIFHFYWSMFAFVVLSLGLSYMSFHGFHPRGLLAYLFAVLPAIAIVQTLVRGGMYLSEETDEFQRHLFVQSILWGVGGIMVLTSVWGWLQLFTHIIPFFTIWTFPFFLVFQSVTWQTLRWRNR
jgi:hypothetical protein